MTLDAVQNLKMKGENSKILGTIGDYEIGAKWKWEFQSHTISKFFFLTSVLFSLLIMAIGCTFVWVEFARLSIKQAELNQISLEILKIQSEVKSELQEMRKLKEELIIAEISSEDHLVNREKRSILDSDKGNLAHNKSKDTKPYKMKKNSPLTSFKHNKKFPSHVMTAVHLERRDVSFTATGSTGIINRWQPQYSLPSIVESVQLEDHNSSLVIPSTGLYLVYAQLCYAVTKESNSFEVRLYNQGATNSQSKIIAQCSAGTTILDNEVTCYTSVVQVLHAGDRVYLQQIQKNRHLLMDKGRGGRSFMGVVKLSN